MERLGWTPEWEHKFRQQAEPGDEYGRIALEHTHLYRIYTERGDMLAEVSGRLRHLAAGRNDFPAVGDWVTIRYREADNQAIINGILPRISKFSRKMAGAVTDEQIVAANVNTVFLVNSLNQDFNVRRLERYLILAWESGANPVVVLTKADLCGDEERRERVAEAEAAAIGVPVYAVSAAAGDGIEALAPYLANGQTVALLGSSGAGKSTLVNRLYGEAIMQVQDIREGDDKGRHTTTHRELVALPGGGVLIDTPGMRELQLWHADGGLDQGFRVVEELSAACRFADCGHGGEPGCAVQEALRSGSLSADRYESYLKLQRELAYLARKEDAALRHKEKERWKKIHMDMRKKGR
ncbi:ribosome small subunit-dependent GTPase A [Paenibacillus ginsengarvi]|uniref:Small ribosomal subunit biogenesis GTPase RsgA n=1 Tax=Paenibacillus ginsengarvi TaxID=400777 RepID=A0A3B0CK47_9BACL|nr:ribosome small subunit-dependent GTPase A [Paenibacillus ginsengarvi]